MKTILYTIIIFLIAISSDAQYYDFVSLNVTYYESDNWTSVSNGEIWDDPEYEIPLPWEFNFYGKTIDKIYISEEGYGAELSTQPYDSPEPYSYITPFNADIIDRGLNGTEALSEIRYTTQVSADNELFIIEWWNVGFYNELEYGISESFISFQVIFNRNFNAISFSYGPSNIANPDLIYEELSGVAVCMLQDIDEDPTTPIGEAICLVGDANNPSLKMFNIDQDDPEFLVGDIPENKLYLFSVNDAVSTSDVILADEINLFPSPAVNIVHIESDILFSNFRITNSMGKLIHDDIIDAQRIDISSLSSGIYFVELFTEDGRKACKSIIKE